MTPQQRINLLRLLKPRHVAVIGGRDAEVCATECARIGFTGPFWPVNPKRPEIGGHRCYASIDDLPEAPDAVFLAIPREPAIEALQKLAAMGAGGVVCYTAGFGETGTDGADMEARLLEAAGDLALVGPNCYGLINYIDKVALWPFAHGGECPGYGAAIITQSGMLSSDFTMSQRSVPFAYMVSAGNQSAIRIEDFIDVLCDRASLGCISRRSKMPCSSNLSPERHLNSANRLSPSRPELRSSVLRSQSVIPALWQEPRRFTTHYSIASESSKSPVRHSYLKRLNSFPLPESRKATGSLH